MKKSLTAGIVTGVALAGILVAGSVKTLTQSTNEPTTNLIAPLSSISRTYSEGECAKNFCWTCDGPVDLESVYLNIDQNTIRDDGAKFTENCTGTIQSLTIITQASDGLKVAGAHDLIVNGGSIKCLSKLPTLHQDAVQVMGGSNLTFNNMTLDCGRESDSLIDSNFFVNCSGACTTPPDHVICDVCYFGPWAASTVNLQASSDSGITNSTICQGKFFGFRKGSDAVNSVNQGNDIKDDC